ITRWRSWPACRTLRVCPPPHHPHRSPCPTVSDHDRYLFDVRDWLAVPGVLSAGEVARYNELLDRLRPEDIADPGERERALQWVFEVAEDFAGHQLGHARWGWSSRQPAMCTHAPPNLSCCFGL